MNNFSAKVTELMLPFKNNKTNYTIPEYDTSKEIDKNITSMFIELYNLYNVLYHYLNFQEYNCKILLENSNKYNKKVSDELEIIKTSLMIPYNLFDITQIFVYKEEIRVGFENLRDILIKNINEYVLKFSNTYKKFKTNKEPNPTIKEIMKKKNENIIYNLDYIELIDKTYVKLGVKNEYIKKLNNLCVSKFYTDSLLSDKLNTLKPNKTQIKKSNTKALSGEEGQLQKNVNETNINETNLKKNSANLSNKIIFQTNDICEIFPREKIINIRDYIIEKEDFPHEVYNILDETQFKNIFKNLVVRINGRPSGLYIETVCNGIPFSHMSFHFVTNRSNSPVHLKGNNLRIINKNVNINIKSFANHPIDCYLQQTMFGIKIITRGYNPTPLEAFIIDISIISLNMLYNDKKLWI